MISLLKNNLNNYFGNIKQLPFEKQILPDAQFTQMTQVSRLKRIFTTNIKAEDAGPRPEKLIPTTEFFDPALLILQSPKKIDENYYLYSLSMRGFEKFLKDDADSNKHFSDLEIKSAITEIRKRFKGGIFAAVTPTSIEWKFSYLVEHLIEEREWYLKSQKGRA